jgi:site-specific recombinase XerD
MKKGFDLHGAKQIREYMIKSISSDDRISPANKEAILKYDSYRIMQDNGVSSNAKVLVTLREFARLLKVDFNSATKDDIIRVFNSLKEKELSPYSIAGRKIIIKCFYKWLKNSDDHPPEVRWMKTSVKKTDRKVIDPSELITEDDVKKLIEVCNHPRDKAFVSVLYESGARIGEIASLQIKNIKFDAHGIIMDVEGKTGKRAVRIISSIPYMATWIENHPFKNMPDAPLWIARSFNPSPIVISYDSLNNLLLIFS